MGHLPRRWKYYCRRAGLRLQRSTMHHRIDALSRSDWSYLLVGRRHRWGYSDKYGLLMAKPPGKFDKWKHDVLAYACTKGLRDREFVALVKRMASGAPYPDITRLDYDKDGPFYDIYPGKYGS